ncbi:MAG: glycosyltransferase [Cytophagales bacterium]|nr:glycosyltransferase [Cytophagales bacterium]
MVTVIVIFGVYFSLLLALLVGWFLVFQNGSRSASIEEQSITVIVPFRNEEQNLPNLLKSLAGQNYPSKLYEVILVDDHSADHSASIVRQFIDEHSNFSLLVLPEGVEGKKRAIDFGVRHCVHEIIVTTDADCTLPPNWLKSISSSFTQHLNMLVGGVKIVSGPTLFSKLQAMEFASLVGSGFATLGFQLPTMANGANLAFRKAAFQKVNGYERSYHIASGDDEHLMQKMHAQFPGSVRPMTDAQSVVLTKPLPTLSDFVQQRLRWAAKWKHNPSVITQSVAVLVLIFQITYAISLVMVVLQGFDNQLLIFLLLAKWVLEFLFLYAVYLFLKLRWHWLSFFLLQLCYPFYVVAVGAQSLFARVEWKGRK